MARKDLSAKMFSTSHRSKHAIKKQIKKHFKQLEKRSNLHYRRLMAFIYKEVL